LTNIPNWDILAYVTQHYGRQVSVQRIAVQLSLFDESRKGQVRPFRQQLLKWVGNKQRFAHEIISYFPSEFGGYYEPFLGSGAVLATLAPENAVGSDSFGPLVEIFQTLQKSPETLKRWWLM
jgi:DNA adenine methylase